jgi:hypothetical protein
MVLEEASILPAICLLHGVRANDWQIAKKKAAFVHAAVAATALYLLHRLNFDLRR